MIFYRILSHLPFTLLYLLSQIAYLLLYYLLRYRREVVRNNLRHSFPDKTEGELNNLGKAFYKQLTEVALEIVKARRMNKEDFLQRARVVNPQLLRDYSNDFQDSIIVLTIHQGNWEWMLHGTTAALGVPMDPVYKPLHSASADRLMLEVRSRFGSRPLPLADSARDILRHRRQFRLLVMVADQSPTRQERSQWTTFMQREAAFHPGAENLARLTGFPVVFAQCHRRHRGHYDIEFHPLATPPHDGEEGSITGRYVHMAEQAIREEPQSWLWSNRRWKRNREQEQAQQ